MAQRNKYDLSPSALKGMIFFPGERPVQLTGKWDSESAEVVYMDYWEKGRIDTKELIIEDLNISLYDFLKHRLSKFSIKTWNEL